MINIIILSRDSSLGPKHLSLLEFESWRLRPLGHQGWLVPPFSFVKLINKRGGLEAINKQLPKTQPPKTALEIHQPPPVSHITAVTSCVVECLNLIKTGPQAIYIFTVQFTSKFLKI